MALTHFLPPTSRGCTPSRGRVCARSPVCHCWWRPARAKGRVVGVLAVGSTVPHRFTEADVELLQRAADRIALAIDRAHLNAAEHDARRQAEEALARAQASVTQAAERAEQLQTILETVVDGVAVYDSPRPPDPGEPGIP